MNLYLLPQSDNTGYDTYDSCVVAAKNEDEARKMHPDGSTPVEKWPTYVFADWAKHPDNVKVELIGRATKGTKAGVILASFNAG